MIKEGKLWVFDTAQYLEVYAETEEKALAQADEISIFSGVDFVLHREWELYQEGKLND
tara:strand:+ start:383 stop:556 length:174 start_codon:yes stop_codon:yes gene_type:complete